NLIQELTFDKPAAKAGCINQFAEHQADLCGPQTDKLLGPRSGQQNNAPDGATAAIREADDSLLKS
ncbi:MAG: hypothetical protein U0Z53_26765, partial [Blastocatellia bacterium]